MRLIIRSFVNGEKRNLRELGITGVVQQVYTIIDENKFAFDPSNGQKITIDNDNAYLEHLENVFLEDRYHDWRIEGDELYFYGHSGSKGQLHDLLLIIS